MKHKKQIFVFAILALLVFVALYPASLNSPIQYLERSTGTIKTEKVAGEKWLVWLYNNPVGELALHTLVKRKILSEFYGSLMDKPSSAGKIDSFVENYDIDLGIVQKQKFETFNDFFIRKLKTGVRKIDMDSMVVVSPADGKMLAFQDVSKQDFIIKGYKFNLEEFLNDSSLANKYQHGSLLIFRLCPTDYHRFHFPVDGQLSQPVKIDGDYYSVSPIALKERVEIFCQNKREYVVLSTKNFGDVIMAEVGATMVGSIVQTYSGNTVWKGGEKGYFKFGGSSIVLIFENNKIRIDDDLLRNTKNNLETSILVGNRVAIDISRTAVDTLSVVKKDTLKTMVADSKANN